MPFVANPGIIQAQSVTLMLTVALQAKQAGVGISVINCAAAIVLAILFQLQLIKANLEHVAVSLKAVFPTSACMTITNPKAAVAFQITAFAHAFVESVHLCAKSIAGLHCFEGCRNIFVSITLI